MNELLANRATLSKRGNDVLLQCEDGEHAAAVFKYIEGVEVEMQQLREENERLRKAIRIWYLGVHGSHRGCDCPLCQALALIAEEEG